MTDARILHMRVEWFAEHYRGPKFHAILCDPPYEYGFMGKSWDRTGIAYRPETWAGLAKHLHPGGFGMAFASSRGWHRLAVAIEDAGLIIHPSIFGWAYGSGFPKATRVRDNGEDVPAFKGHRYGLQALKPALEPIIVFQKPYQGRPVDNITATGAGALNIDGARIGTESTIRTAGVTPSSRSAYGKFEADEGTGRREYGSSSGRWPANLLLLDDGAASALDAQSGTLASRFFYRVRAALDAADPVCYTAKASRAEREAGLDTRKATKPVFGPAGDAYRGLSDSKTFRVNRHPTVKPLDLARYLATLLLPPDEYAPRRILVPFAGSGSECIGAFMAGWDEIVGVEFIREYVDIARARLAYWMSQGAQLDFVEELTA